MDKHEEKNSTERVTVGRGMVYGFLLGSLLWGLVILALMCWLK